MKRLEDIKDYEESERIAARVAAAMTAYIKKTTPDDYSMDDVSSVRHELKMSPGMVFDNLAVGEDIGTIQSNRPSGLLGEFRDAMVRAVAGGVGGNYSSISKKYDGNYSAQRQELVESYANYNVLTDSFAGMITLPTYEKVIQVAILAGLIQIPKDIDLDTLYECEFYGPKMPWVDPLKDIRANQEAVTAGFKSAQQVIRDFGNNPDAVMEQSADWQSKAKEKGLNFSVFEPPLPQPITNEPA
jgi:lambda family phage portal protein